MFPPDILDATPARFVLCPLFSIFIFTTSFSEKMKIPFVKIPFVGEKSDL
jgi:hypothetical protein